MNTGDFFGQALQLVTVAPIGGDAQARTYIHARTQQAISMRVIPVRPLPDDDSFAVIAVTPSLHWAGFATWYQTTTDRLWLDILWVEPEWRRQGVALQLLGAVRHAARSARLKGVACGHLENNVPMVALMRRAGWPVDHIVRSIPAQDLFARTEG